MPSLGPLSPPRGTRVRRESERGMATGEILDFDALLAPVEGDNPAGVDLRQDVSPQSPYRKIRDARQTAAREERRLKQAEDGSGITPDWRPVLDGVPEVLANKSKDLELVAYLIEALARKHGFAGLRDGFRLTRQLCEQYWDQLYPQPDDEGIASRVVYLSALNGEDAEGTLLEPINCIPITEARGSDEQFACWHHRQAATLASLSDPEAKARRISQGAITLEILQRAVADTPTEFLRELAQDMADCREEFEKLCGVLDERCGTSEDGYPLAPPASGIRNALENSQSVLKSLAGRRLDPPAEPGDPDDPGALPPSVRGANGLPGGRLATREDAFHVLMKVADYFEENEPQSFVPSALRQVVRWGRMSASEFYTELIPDDAIRDYLFKMTGIPRTETSE